MEIGTRRRKEGQTWARTDNSTDGGSQDKDSVVMAFVRASSTGQKLHTVRVRSVGISAATPFGAMMQLVVTSCVAAVYLKSMHPSLPGGDAGELIVAANELGVAHPPGYPLYTLMMKTWFLLVQYGSLAWRANLLTSLLAACAAGFLFQSVFMLTGSTAAGLLASGMFSWSRLTWMWSVTAEVFALNNLLVSVLLLLAVIFHQSSIQQKGKWASFGALVCGLCLANQHTTVVYVGVLVPWVFFTLCQHKVLTLPVLMRLAAYFVLGLLPYAYLPISSIFSSPRWTWGDQSTIAGFFTHLFRQEYGTLHLLKDHEGQGLIAGLMAYLEHVVKDLTPAVLFFFAATVFSIYQRWQRRDCQMVTVMLIMWAAYIFFFSWRANLDIEKPLFKGVVERFWLQGDLLLAALASVAFSDVFRIVNRLIPVVKWHADIVLSLALVGMQLTMNFPMCDQSSNRLVEEFALTTLKAFPHGAIVLTKGDLPSNSLRYYHLTEGVRSDLTLFDQEILTYEWSIPKLGHHAAGILWPGNKLHLRSGMDNDGRLKFTFQQLLDANYDRKQIFACIGVQDHESSWKAAYELRPFGVCTQFIKKGSRPKMEEWIQASKKFAAEWSHPVPLTEYTWEDVASAEMWRAKTVAGLHMLETADGVKNKEQRASLLRHAYQIYREAVESHLHFPGYWHKNFALVCEKLRHVTSDTAEKVPLLKTTIAHFRAYLDTGTRDPEVSGIEDAIKQLQQYLDFIER